MKILKIALTAIFYLSSVLSSSVCPEYHSDVISKCEPDLQKIFNLALSIRKLNADIALYGSKFKQLHAKVKQGCKKGEKECDCLENIVEKHSELNHQATLKQSELQKVEAKLPENCKRLAEFRKSLVKFSSDRS